MHPQTDFNPSQDGQDIWPIFRLQDVRASNNEGILLGNNTLGDGTD